MRLRSFELLDRLAVELGLEPDPRVIREAVQRGERERASDGPGATTQALSRVSGDLGIRISLLGPSSAKEAAALATPAAPVIMATPGTDGPAWVLIRLKKGSRVQVAKGLDGWDWLSLKELATMAGASTPSSAVVAALVQPQAPLTDMAEEAAQHVMQPGANPLPRVLGLFRPEWAEIRIVIAYAIAVGILSLATPLAIETMVTTVAFNQVFQPVVILALLLFAGLSLAAIMWLLQVYVVEIIQRRLFVRVVSDLAYRLPRVKLQAYDIQYGPELVNRFFDVLTVQKVCSSLLLDGVSVILSAIVGMTVLAIYNFWLLGFDILLLMALSFSVFLLGRGAISTSVGESRAKYSVAGFLEELARTPTSFRSDETRQYALDQADGLTRSYVSFRTRHFAVVWRQTVFAALVQAVASAGLLGIGGFLVIDGQLTLGQLVAAELIVATLAASFVKLAKHFDSYYDLMAAVEKIGLMLDLPLEERGGERLPPSTVGIGVEVSRLGYEYTPDANPAHGPGSRHEHGHPHIGPHIHALAGLSFKLAPGERVALRGPSGSGKSTLLEILHGERLPTEGRVEIEGIDLRELNLESLRHDIAIVRKGGIIEGTIIDNVRMGRSEISLCDIRKALGGLGLLAELSELPGGLRTRLNPDGAPLSRRQIWRLLLARGLAGRPRFLLIDEGLDLLSPAERERVLDELLDRTQPWTVLVVTESPDALKRCDRVVELSQAPHGHDSSHDGDASPSGHYYDGGSNH